YRAVARRGVRWLAYGLVAAVGYIWRRAIPQRHTRASTLAILVVRLDLLGDVLFSLQAVEGLRARHPGARIVMLTLPYTAELARQYPWVDEVLTVDTNRIRTPLGL